jgi:membrane protein implicated in regulation of membrane protease activity
MDHTTFWWLATGLLVIAELLTGTFYLLMLSVGAVAGAMAAHLEASFTTQVVVAAFVGGAAVVLWSLKQQAQPATPSAQQHLDVGETVNVEAWDEQGQTHVKHRGAQWSAQCVQGRALELGLHRIVEVTGNRLILEKV